MNKNISSGTFCSMVYCSVRWLCVYWHCGISKKKKGIWSSLSCRVISCVIVFGPHLLKSILLLGWCSPLLTHGVLYGGKFCEEFRLWTPSRGNVAVFRRWCWPSTASRYPGSQFQHSRQTHWLFLQCDRTYVMTFGPPPKLILLGSLLTVYGGICRANVAKIVVSGLVLGHSVSALGRCSSIPEMVVLTAHGYSGFQIHHGCIAVSRGLW